MDAKRRKTRLTQLFEIVLRRHADMEQYGGELLGAVVIQAFRDSLEPTNLEARRFFTDGRSAVFSAVLNMNDGLLESFAKDGQRAMTNVVIPLPPLRNREPATSTRRQTGTHGR